MISDIACISGGAWDKSIAGNSNAAQRKGKANQKPEKPFPDSPLFAHATRHRAKKIRGKLHYFGPWDHPDTALALEKYLDQRDDLHAGRIPRTTADGFTVRELLNHILAAKQHQLDTSEITHRTFEDYRATCDRIAKTIGPMRLVDDLAADEFQLLRAGIARNWGPVALGNEVQRVRCLFKYAYDAGLVDRPVRYGPTFKRPGRKGLRRERRRNGKCMFEADELREAINKAPLQLKDYVAAWHQLRVW